MVIAFVLQAICLLLVLGRRPDLGRLVRVHARARLLHLGRNLFVVPGHSADYFGTRHATSNYAVLYTAKGVASIIGGWVGALLFEQFGSWSVGFYGSAVMALVAAALAIGLRSSVAPLRAPAGIPRRRASGYVLRATRRQLAPAAAPDVRRPTPLATVPGSFVG